ncbi:MAG: sugar phosphate isomerase/epimerase [Planctomycetia bacterium]|nr:sugar phosphate isomerase/epimerase [Planctomycetia bacterium]
MFKNLSPEALGISGRESEVIELALSHGFKGLDLDLVDFAEQVKAQGMPRASRLIISARLKIGSFRVPVRWEDDSPDYKTDLQKLPELAELAQQMGCTRATATIEPANDWRPYHENFEFHRRRFAEMADVLAPYRIRLGIGFLSPLCCRAGRTFQFIQVADAAILLLRTIGATNVGLAFDSWHWHLGGGTLDQLRAVQGDKIVTVSLADCDADATAESAQLESRRLPSEGGALDAAALLSTLAELHYDGPVTPAPDKSQFAALGRDKIVKQAGVALDRVWKAAGLNLAGKLATVSGR